MKVLLRLCYVIIRKNIGFTIGLLLLLTLSMSIFVLGTAFPTSINKTVDCYNQDYCCPDAWINAVSVSNQDEKDIESLSNIKEINHRYMADNEIKTSDGQIFSVRFFSYKESDFLKQYNFSQADNNNTFKGIKVCITHYFAVRNNIKSGDIIKIKTNNGYKKAYVEALVASPETVCCARGENTILSEYSQFGYVYTTQKNMNKIFGKFETGHQLLIRFNNNVSKKQRENTINEIKDMMSDKYISDIVYEDSNLKTGIRNTVDQLTVICYAIPSITIIIALFFALLFIRQIVRNQRKMISLLRAMGYSRGQVLFVFELYSVILGIISIFIGIPIGYFALQNCLKICAQGFDIGITYPTLHLLYLYIFIVILLMICMLSCLFSVREISTVDPSEAFNDNICVNSRLMPKFIQKIKVNSFTKIGITSLWRHKRRLIISSLCIAACIILMTDTIESLMSNIYPVHVACSERYHYDYSVQIYNNNDETSYKSTIDDIRDIDGIETVEPVGLYSATLRFNREKADIDIQAIGENSSLITPKSQSGNPICLSDGITIDEKTANNLSINIGDTITVNKHKLKVTDITRELTYIASYIRIKTAKKIKYDYPEKFLIKLSDNANFQKVYNKLKKLYGYSYISSFERSSENMSERYGTTQSVMWIFALFAFLIGMVIVYNMVITSVNEKLYEYAMMIALGAEFKKFGVISIIENIARYFISLIVAIPLCNLTVSILFRILSSSDQQYVAVKVLPVVLSTCSIAFLYVIVGVVFTFIKIKRMKIIDILNSKE